MAPIGCTAWVAPRHLLCQRSESSAPLTANVPSKQPNPDPSTPKYAPVESVLTVLASTVQAGLLGGMIEPAGNGRAMPVVLSTTAAACWPVSPLRLVNAPAR